MGREIDWQFQNNKCVDQSYSRHISNLEFRELMLSLGEYAVDYNLRQANETSHTDRRLITGFEDHSLPMKTTIRQETRIVDKHADPVQPDRACAAPKETNLS